MHLNFRFLHPFVWPEMLYIMNMASLSLSQNHCYQTLKWSPNCFIATHVLCTLLAMLTPGVSVPCWLAGSKMRYRTQGAFQIGDSADQLTRGMWKDFFERMDQAIEGKHKVDSHPVRSSGQFFHCAKGALLTLTLRIQTWKLSNSPGLQKRMRSLESIISESMGRA